MTKNRSILMIIIALVLIMFIFLSDNHRSVNSWRLIDHSVQPNITVFIGDSITELADLQDYFKDTIVINKGIIRDITYGVMNRLEKDVYELQPSKVFLLIGINDLYKKISNETIINNIEQIIKNIKINCPKTKIYLQSIYPINNSDNKKIIKEYFINRKNKDIIYINDHLKDIADNNGITYIDLYSHLIDDSNNLKIEYTYDGLHYTKTGYDKIFKIIKPYVYNN